MEERKTLYLLDGSAVDDDNLNNIPLTERLYDAVKNPGLIDSDQIERNMAYLVRLKKFSETRPLITIPETIREQRAHLEVLNEQYGLIKAAMSVQNNKKALARKRLRHAGKTFRENEAQEELEDAKEALEKLRVYGQVLTGFVKQLENRPITPDDLNSSEYAMWQWAYKRASAIHTQPDNIKGYKKLGAVLETDVKMVAMTLALSLENPVTMMCRDYGANKTLHRVNMTAGPNWRGKPRYEVSSAREIDEVTYLEERSKSTQPQMIRLVQEAQETQTTNNIN